MVLLSLTLSTHSPRISINPQGSEAGSQELTAAIAFYGCDLGGQSPQGTQCLSPQQP